LISRALLGRHGEKAEKEWKRQRYTKGNEQWKRKKVIGKIRTFKKMEGSRKGRRKERKQIERDVGL
jgi:hypothetical protein